MERTLISFNLPNWITVILMVALGYLVFSIVSQIIMGGFGSRSAPQNLTASAQTGLPQMDAAQASGGY
jgi:hypothetical protein